MTRELAAAERAVTARRDDCRRAYAAVLVAMAMNPGSAAELAGCRRELARADIAYREAVIKAWRARAEAFVPAGVEDE